MSAPVLEFRAATSPNAVLSSLQLVGTGPSSAVVAGQTSSVSTLRLYNNFNVVDGIGDALNCVLALYDSVGSQGSATGQSVSGAWVQVQVTDYNGLSANSDIQYYSIGGSTKHAVPVNSSTVAASSGGIAAANYITINSRVVVPVGASTGVQAAALWCEFSYV